MAGDLGSPIQPPPMLAPKPSTAVTNGLLQCWESMSSQVTDGPGAASSEPLLAPKASTPSEQRSVIGSEPAHHVSGGDLNTDKHPPPPYKLPEVTDATLPNGRLEATATVSQSDGGSFRSRIREIGREVRTGRATNDPILEALSGIGVRLNKARDEAQSELRRILDGDDNSSEGHGLGERANVPPGPVYKTQFDPRNDIPWPSTLIPRPAGDETKTPWLGSYDPNESVYHNICNIRSLCHRNEQRLIGIETQLSEMKRLLVSPPLKKGFMSITDSTQLRPRPIWYPFNPPTPAPMEL
ncbi:hypothetical protein CcaCcLH18_07586 [Colletotrichum camelliae]|nr:hypothetical protein CcaCcLH18_07586 [Colletotrichum camelliae]